MDGVKFYVDSIRLLAALRLTNWELLWLYCHIIWRLPRSPSSLKRPKSKGNACPGLVHKLIFAGAAEKDRNELRFTYAFVAFLRSSTYIKNKDRPTDGPVEENWRQILSGFNYSLVSLSYCEIVALLLFLELHFNNSSKDQFSS